MVIREIDLSSGRVVVALESDAATWAVLTPSVIGERKIGPSDVLIVTRNASGGVVSIDQHIKDRNANNL
jgi:hypothetical protein